jgi:glucan 1,3-beta-glucosidase
MVFRVGLLVLSLAAVASGWWWLGQPVALPEAARAEGGKFGCMSYAPFRDGQTPLDLTTHIPAAQIDDDLKRLSAMTLCVRTYSVHLGSDQVVPIAQTHGLKVLLGIWIGRDREFNRKQIATAIDLANRYPQVIRAIVVGNEVLLRGEQSPEALADTIRAVKSRVAVPVTYADVWEFWLRNPKLADAVDFITIHILPYWEDMPIAADIAADHVVSIYRRLANAFPGREILLGEVGWPSAGRMREGALPSPVNQARVLQEVIARAHAEKFPVNVIEAFDQAWKRRFEGTVGGHWGLFDGATRAPKFLWGQPVSNHPKWQTWAALGGLLAAASFLAAAVSERRRSAASGLAWLGVAAIAVAGGLLFGLSLEAALVESLGWGGALRSLALCAVALAAPILTAGMLTRGSPAPSFARIFAAPLPLPSLSLESAGGMIFAVAVAMAVQAALGLVFDARYRDFPTAPLSIAVIAYGVLRIAGTGVAGKLPLAEGVTAALLALSAIFIVIHETLANWQAVWLSAALVGLAAILASARDAPAP